MNAEQCTYLEKTFEKAPITPDLENLHNQKVKAKVQLSTTYWGVEIMPQHR